MSLSVLCFSWYLKKNAIRVRSSRRVYSDFNQQTKLSNPWDGSQEKEMVHLGHCFSPCQEQLWVSYLLLAEFWVSSKKGQFLGAFSFFFFLFPLSEADSVKSPRAWQGQVVTLAVKQGWRWDVVLLPLTDSHQSLCGRAPSQLVVLHSLTAFSSNKTRVVFGS